ncbi:hypothetical protein V6N11_049757 [Hibiscus sabdariffa]|uniref:RNase H type-1 domain-containing protein n=1 Tax=Hibiscus sabdariffa TaxID=183260 RepID=A0ABR2T7V3_9ROSI
MAELWAISNGLVHGWRMGLRKIILQSDNRMVIDILQAPEDLESPNKCCCMESMLPPGSPETPWTLSPL